MNKVLLLAVLAVFGLAGCVTTTPNLYAGQKDLAKAARINTKLGSAYMQQGNYVRAKSNLQRALKQHPTLAAAHSTLARRYTQQGRADKAKDQRRKAMDLTPDDPSLQNQYATFLCMQNHYDRAMKLFRSAAANPQYVTSQVAWTNAGVCERRQGHPEKAAAYFRKALRLSPDYSSALLQLADLSSQQGRYLQARALMERYGQGASPTPSSLLLNVRIYHALGQDDQAMKYAQELEKKFPASSEMGQLEQALGNG